MYILLIDDQPENVAALREELSSKSIEHSQVDFAAAEAAIQQFDPNIIVLDLMLESAGEQNAAGLDTFEFVWTKRFCPLIVYTGFPESLEDDRRRSHPFIKVVKKGQNSEIEVLTRIQEFQSQVSALDAVQKEIKTVMNRALKEVAPRVCQPGADAVLVEEVLVRSARRRVAAAMDDCLSTQEGVTLRAWEHYLSPPLGTSLLTGDVLRLIAGNQDEPNSYYVVLTPSCDLVQEGTRKAKVKHVLLARCHGVSRLLTELSPPLKDAKEGTDSEKAKRMTIQSILSQGHGKTCLPMPSLPGVFPALVADFRDLVLVDLPTILRQESPEYTRVASVDSPFRELVAWGYMICAARPAMPDRDVESWMKELLPEKATTPSPPVSEPKASAIRRKDDGGPASSKA